MLQILNRYTQAVLYTTENANLCGADLRDANLRYANLCGADLCGANLCGANLCYANLCGANLRGADLCGADLRGANLCGANLSDADLSGADLRDANLSDADLRGANLCGAYLRYADLRGAYLREAKEIPTITEAQTTVPAQGTIIGWKKCKYGVIVKLSIPEDSQRSNATGRKCRCQFADVVEVIGAEVGISQHDEKTEYRVGQRVTCDVWCEDRWQECAGGIHFFITRPEAEAY